MMHTRSWEQLTDSVFTHDPELQRLAWTPDGRPKVLSDEQRSELLRRIIGGETLDTAASAVGVSRSTVHRRARIDPSLRAALDVARAERDRRKSANGRGPRIEHPMYSAYRDMRLRCSSPSRKSYEYYGARGITVCERWLADFWNFIDDMGERPAGMSLDRIDNDGPYSPENCRWATPSQQRMNSRRGRLRQTSAKNECIRGHVFDAANTRWRGSARDCRACERARNRAYRRAQRTIAATTQTYLRDEEGTRGVVTRGRKGEAASSALLAVSPT